MTDHFYLNGALTNATDCRLSITDRSYLLGDGLFETILVKNGKPVYLREHMQRLTASCGFFAYDAPQPDQLTDAVHAVIEANSLDAAALRLTLSPRESQGLLAAPGSALNILVTFRRGEPYAVTLYERGLIAVIAQTTRRNEHSSLSRHKTTNFLDSVLARKEAQARGADEALLLNTKGNLAEGSVSNLFLVINGNVLTPRVEDGALPGIVRAKVLELCRDQGIPAQEEMLSPDDFGQADEAFLTNSLLGVMPLSEVESSTLSRTVPGRITHLLMTTVSDDMEAKAEALS